MVMKTFEQTSRTTGSQRDWVRVFMACLFIRKGFAQRQPRSVADVENAHFVIMDVKKNAVLVLPLAVKNLADFLLKKTASRRKGTTFRKFLQRGNGIQQSIIP